MTVKLSAKSQGLTHGGCSVGCQKGVRAFIARANTALPGNSSPAVMTIASVDSVVEEGMTILSRVVYASWSPSTTGELIHAAARIAPRRGAISAQHF